MDAKDLGCAVSDASLSPAGSRSGSEFSPPPPVSADPEPGELGDTPRKGLLPLPRAIELEPELVSPADPKLDALPPVARPLPSVPPAPPASSRRGAWRLAGTEAPG